MNNIYLIVGESGAGKTTIAEALCEKHGWTQIQSYTNRPPRSDDEAGHCFISAEVFPTFTEIERVFDDIVARTEYNGHCYFCTAAQIEDDDLYVIDPAGIEYFREHYTGNKGVRIIYIYVEPEQRLVRMLGRGDDHEKAMERLKNDEDAERTGFFKVYANADYVAYNTGSLSICVQDIANYIFKEESR